VAVYQSGAAYTTTTTNENGYYEFPIGSFPVENVIVSARKPQYFDNYRRVDKSSDAPVNISLLPVGQQGLQTSSLNPMDSMILLSGQLINHKEIIQMLGITASASRAQLSKAKKLIREQLNKQKKTELKKAMYERFI